MNIKQMFTINQVTKLLDALFLQLLTIIVVILSF